MKFCARFFLTLSCIIISSCSLGSFTTTSQSEKRLHENIQYGALLFQKEAPEILPPPLDYNTHVTCSLAAIDSLFIEQIKGSPTYSEAFNTVKTEIEKKFHGIELTTIPSLLIDKSTSIEVEKISPIAGTTCQRAYINQYLTEHPYKKMKFPTIFGIEVVQKENPTLLILSSFENGLPYTKLLKCISEKAQETAFLLLGEALAEVHSSTPQEKGMLPPQWIEAIHHLVSSFSQHYQVNNSSIANSANYLSDCILRILSSYEKKKKKFYLGIALNDSDLASFLYLNKKQVLYRTPNLIGASLPTSSHQKPQGVLAFDYCRLWHSLNLYGASSLPKEKLLQLAKAFEKGYSSSTLYKPAKDELLFFTLLDLMYRIEQCHRYQIDISYSTHPKIDSSISLSLLEAELVQWSDSLQQMRAKR